MSIVYIKKYILLKVIVCVNVCLVNNNSLNSKNKKEDKKMGKIIIITGVSCAGKSTLLGNIAEKYPRIHFPESMATRPQSKRDENSRKKYNHISEKEFLEKISENYFLEFQKVHNNYYGTPKSCLTQAFNEKKDIVLDIDPKGAINLLKQKDFDHGFTVKAFWIWRKFHPEEDVKLIDLMKSVEKNIRLREEDIDEKTLRDRVNSALHQYPLAKENAGLFKFIQNEEGDPLYSFKEFAIWYNPSTWL